MIDLEKLKDVWLSKLSVENKSIASRTSYNADLNQFFKYLKDKDMILESLELSDAREFVIYKLEVSGLKPASLKRMISTIKQFLKWLVETEVLIFNPFQDVKIQKTNSPLPSILSEEELSQLLDSDYPEDADDIEKQLWVRDRAILEMMYSCGLRVAELCSLKITDIDPNQKLVRIRSGKGNKDRIVPVGSKALKALNAWYELRDQLKVELDEKTCFISFRTLKKLTTNAVWRRVDKQGKKFGIQLDNMNFNHIHPHTMRHCFATHMLNASDDLRAVQELLGHENISTTAIYTQVSTNRLMKEYDKAHPRAVRKGKSQK